MIKLLFYFSFLSIVFCVSCSSSHSSETTTKLAGDSIQNTEPALTETPPIAANSSEYATFIFLSDSTSKTPSYGYDILIDGAKFIHQPYIPSISGNKGFATKEKAEATAQLVIHKLKNNIMPPSLSPKELDSLGILK
jgi:Domain of unknown function (DUF4907)